MSREWIRFGVAAACLAVFYVNPARADGELVEGGEVIETTGAAPGTICERDSEECATTLIRHLSNLNFIPMAVSGGVTAESPYGAGAVEISVVGGQLPIGSIDIGRFDAVYLPGREGVRLRFRLGELEAMFLCHTPDDETAPPVAGAMRSGCQPDGFIGFGAELLEMQWDTWSGRFTGEWAALNMVLNFFANGNGVEYLRRHLNLTIGANVRTTFYGDLAGEAGADARTDLGVYAALTGLIRSRDSRWEGQGEILVRPVIVGGRGPLQDIEVQGSARLLHNFLISDVTAAQVGIDAEVSYFSNPSDAFGRFASDRTPVSVYVGAVMGVRFGR